MARWVGRRRRRAQQVRTDYLRDQTPDGRRVPLGGGQLSGYRPIAEVLREPTALLTPVTRGELARRAAACGTDPNPLMTPLARQRTTLGDGGQP